MQKKTEKKLFWQRLENTANGEILDIEEVQNALQFNDDGLIPVISQCATSGQVLMLAWMNLPALKQTLAAGEMVYYSRSRQTLWRKGETSGHTQQLIALSCDCDGDTLLAKIKQTGAACHTNRPSCFYVQLAPKTCIDDNESN
ncbi:MAG: phosphoribosyl-AMP cyclohydrolase [Proteobacteria bacterium]|nr:phosphoribosyl-AMP cyclohydrolase [Pseudomonadota bacterium]